MPTKRADGVPEGFDRLQRGMAAQKAVDQAVGRVVPNSEMLLRSEIARLQQMLTITTDALTEIRYRSTLKTIHQIANRAILRVEDALRGQKPESTSTGDDESQEAGTRS